MVADEIKQLVVFLALAAGLLVPLEQLFPRERIATSWRSITVDIAWLVACAIVLNVVVAPVLAVFTRVDGNDHAWRIALAFAGAELGAYASHRLMHAVPWLWRFHAVHHVDEPLTWTKAWRQHPLDIAIHSVVVALPALLLGVSLVEFGAILLVRRLWTGFLHANVRVRFGFLEHVIATPAFHHAHHSNDPACFNSNFAGLLPVLDHIFGTWRPLANDGESSRRSPRPRRR